MTIEECIKSRLTQRLEEACALVVYDPDRRYSEIVGEMAGDKCTLIDGSVSTIIGRELAMDEWGKLAAADGDDKRLVIYLPTAKPKTEQERQQNPYEVFTLGGGEFPVPASDAVANMRVIERILGG